MKATIEGYERAFSYTLETEPEQAQPEDRNDTVAYVKAMLPSMAKWQVEELGAISPGPWASGFMS